MKNEEQAVKLFNGVTDVGDDLIEEAGTVRKRKKMTPWRGAAIAACLCLALVGTAGAQIFGIQLRSSDDGRIQMSGGIAHYPYENLSDELKKLEGESCVKAFASWQELEDFVGVDLMNNPVLDASVAALPNITGVGMPAARFSQTYDGVNGQFLLRTSVGLNYITAIGCFEISNINVSVDSFLYTERQTAWENWDEIFMGIQYQDAQGLIQESYTAPNGLETQLVTVRRDKGWDVCMAAVSLNGIPTVVRAYVQNDNVEEARGALLQVLDGFQI